MFDHKRHKIQCKCTDCKANKIVLKYQKILIFYHDVIEKDDFKSAQTCQ